MPVAFFQALGRTERDSAQSEGTGIRPPTANKTPDHDSGYSDASPTSSAIPGQRLSKSGGKGGAMVYGIVMYDFVAERADELNAKAGEAIIVIAQSNPEWFVAKPIGRLGGPGLIPVSFIEIRDMATDRAIVNPGDAIKQAGVPRVEEWKKMAAEYKNSSITLGKFEAGQQQMEQGMERLSLQQQADGQSGGHSRAQSTQQATRHVSNSTSDLYAPIQARIPRYCFAEEKYWFVIEAMLEDGRHWELSRYYEDFYDFQIALLTEFPTEAGNTGSQKRSLPYMPGPVSYVTDAITEGRLHNLDAYVKNLLGQPAYISRCTLVKQFFAPREGDYEMDGNANGQEYRDSQESHQSRSPTNGDSRDGSRSNLNGGGYGGMSSGPRQTSGSGPGRMHNSDAALKPKLTRCSWPTATTDQGQDVLRRRSHSPTRAPCRYSHGQGRPIQEASRCHCNPSGRVGPRRAATVFSQRADETAQQLDERLRPGLGPGKVGQAASARRGDAQLGCPKVTNSHHTRSVDFFHSLFFSWVQIFPLFSI